MQVQLTAVQIVLLGVVKKGMTEGVVIADMEHVAQMMVEIVGVTILVIAVQLVIAAVLPQEIINV